VIDWLVKVKPDNLVIILEYRDSNWWIVGFKEEYLLPEGITKAIEYINSKKE
jgi:hypothetical protein